MKNLFNKLFNRKKHLKENKSGIVIENINTKDAVISIRKDDNKSRDEISLLMAEEHITYIMDILASKNMYLGEEDYLSFIESCLSKGDFIYSLVWKRCGGVKLLKEQYFKVLIELASAGFNNEKYLLNEWIKEFDKDEVFNKVK